MPDRLLQIGACRAIVYDAHGPALRTEADASDFLAKAWSMQRIRS